MKQVLIVDDEPISRELIRAMLNRYGYSVVGEAADVPTALEYCDSRQPEIVLFDLELRDGDGMAMLVELRARHPGIVAVIVTGMAHADLMQEAREKGAHEFLVKPFNTTRLIQTIESAIENFAGHRTPRLISVVGGRKG